MRDEYTVEDVAYKLARSTLELTLVGSRTYGHKEFVEQMAAFGKWPAVQRILQWHITTANLTILNRPGAWLVDYAYTLVCVL